MNEQASEAGLAPQEQRTGMMAGHLLGAILGILGALIYWLIKKDKSEQPFVQDQAKEILNFEINILIVGIVAAIVATMTGLRALTTAVTLLNLILCIFGAVKAYGGVSFRYPAIIRLLK